MMKTEERQKRGARSTVCVGTFVRSVALARSREKVVVCVCERSEVGREIEKVCACVRLDVVDVPLGRDSVLSSAHRGVDEEHHHAHHQEVGHDVAIDII